MFVHQDSAKLMERDTFQIRGIHLLAGMLLMNMNIAVAFICLRNLLERPCLRAFYCSLSDEIEAYYRVSVFGSAL